MKFMPKFAENLKKLYIESLSKATPEKIQQDISFLKSRLPKLVDLKVGNSDTAIDEAVVDDLPYLGMSKSLSAPIHLLKTHIEKKNEDSREQVGFLHPHQDTVDLRLTRNQLSCYNDDFLLFKDVNISDLDCKSDFPSINSRKNKRFNLVDVDLSYAKNAHVLSTIKAKKVHLRLNRTTQDSQRNEIVKFLKEVENHKHLIVTIDFKTRLNEPHLNLILHLLSINIVKLCLEVKERYVEELSNEYKAKLFDAIRNIPTLQYLKVVDYTSQSVRNILHSRNMLGFNVNTKPKKSTTRINLIKKNLKTEARLDQLLTESFRCSERLPYNSDFLDDIEIY